MSTVGENNSVEATPFHENNMTGSVDVATYRNATEFNSGNLGNSYELNSMGMEVEAEDDEKDPSLNAPKIKTAKKPDANKGTTCRKILNIDEASPQQVMAIKRIGTKEGLVQITKWIDAAIKEQDARRLTNLLAQLYHADVNMEDMQELKLGRVIGGLSKKGFNKDIKSCADEIKAQWSQKIQLASHAPKIVPKPVPKPASSNDVKSKATITPIIPKEEKTVENKTVKVRPKTVLQRNSKFRSTGLEDEEPDVDVAKRQPSGLAIPPRPLPLNKPKAVVSDVFAQTLSGPDSISPKAVLRKKPDATPVMVAAPKKPEVVPTTAPITALKPGYLLTDNGPDPSRLPKPGATKKERRIHFSDDKGEELVRIKFIESCLINGKRVNDMKHADAEHENKMLKQNKQYNIEQGDDEDDLNNSLTNPSEVDTEFRMVPYMPFDVKQYNQELIDEENEREQRTMASFYLPDAPSAEPMEEDRAPFAHTQPPGPNGIPKIALEAVEVLPEPEEVSEAMIVDEPLDSNAAAPVEMMDTDIQIVSDVDVHGLGAKKPSVSDELRIIDQDLSKPSPINPIGSKKVDLSQIKSILSKVQKTALPTQLNVPAPGLILPPSLATGISPILSANPSIPSLIPSAGLSNDLMALPVDIHSVGSAVLQQPFAGIRPQRNQGPRAPSQNICQFHLRNTCSFGANCRNLHVDPPREGLPIPRPRMAPRLTPSTRFDAPAPLMSFNPNPPMEVDNDERNGDTRRSRRRRSRSRSPEKRRYRRRSRSRSPRRSRSRDESPRRSRSRSPFRRSRH
uniref:C3H1-type domain-containing protein n=1 Tax=Panagrolaimus sp. JU765 TaxID=591449 RepID=A0AC34QNA4_9BILA